MVQINNNKQQQLKNKNNNNNHKTTRKSSTTIIPTSSSNSSSSSHSNGSSSSHNNASNTSNKIEYEFGGPYGTAINIIALPFVVMSLLHWCDIGYIDLTIFQQLFVPTNAINDNNNNDNSTVSNNYDDNDNNNNTKTIASIIMSTIVQSTFFKSTLFCPSCSTSSTTDEQEPYRLVSCTIGLLCWFVIQILFERFLPCDLVYGTIIKNNPKYGRLLYRINGHLSFWLTLLIVFIGYPYYNKSYQLWQLSSFPIELLYKYNTELAFCTIILCYLLSFYLYIRSFQLTTPLPILATGGNTGNYIYDFFIGRELNPRYNNNNNNNSTFDYKFFCELRPGLIGWVLLNLSYMKVQYTVLGYNTYSMYLLNFFQGMYVWDALYNEKAILTTMDITTDGFGFMLVFGDLCWVPFTYSLQAKYLVKHDPHLSIYTIVLILCLYAIGYYIFRASNSQKDIFRSNPNDITVQHLQYLQTKRGTKLLTSGWWGYARGKLIIPVITYLV
jgi:Delta14-sterol reductase